jgi:hypothetical protein
VRTPKLQALGRSRLVLGLIVGGPEAADRASRALFVAANPANRDPGWLKRSVVPVTEASATRTIRRDHLVVGDSATGRAGRLCVAHLSPAPIRRQPPRDRVSGEVTATNNRPVAGIGLVHDRHVRAAANARRDPCAHIVDHLGADRTRRQEPTNEPAVPVKPARDGTVIQTVNRVAALIVDIAGDHDLAVVPAHDALAPRELDQDREHRLILMGQSNRQRS